MSLVLKAREQDGSFRTLEEFCERVDRLAEERRVEDAGRPERSMFERREVEVCLDDGRTMTAWTYFYKRPLVKATEIPDGDYARYRTE